MIPHIASVEVLVCIVSKDGLVLGPVEDATAGTHHGCYGHNLLRTLQHSREPYRLGNVSSQVAFREIVKLGLGFKVLSIICCTKNRVP